MWSPYRPVQHRGMYLRCASICTQTTYLIFDIWPVDSLPDPDQCNLIRSIPAETAHTLSHGSSQQRHIKKEKWAIDIAKLNMTRDLCLAVQSAPSFIAQQVSLKK